MRIFRLTLAVLLTFMVVPPTVSAGGAEEEHTELGEKMEKMNAAWRKLRRQVADPALNASSLELITVIKSASIGADAFVPVKITEMPASDRPAALAEFAAGMVKLHELLDGLAAALHDGDNEKGAKYLADIANHQRDAHKAFRKPPPDKAS